MCSGDTGRKLIFAAVSWAGFAEGQCGWMVLVGLVGSDRVAPWFPVVQEVGWIKGLFWVFQEACGILV